MKKTLALGPGNILRRDEGVVLPAVGRLEEWYGFPPEVRVLNGRTVGLYLLPCVGHADRLLVIDALDIGAEPGAVVRLDGVEVPAFRSVKISAHQMGLADLLAATAKSWYSGACRQAS